MSETTIGQATGSQADERAPQQEQATDKPPAYRSTERTIKQRRKPRSQASRGTSASSKNGVFERVEYRNSKAFRQTWRVVPQAAFLYTERILEGFNDDSKALFRHILSSSRLWNHERPAFWVPISSNLLRREFRKASIMDLVKADLLIAKDEGAYSRATHRSREFAVDPDVIRHFEYAIEDGRGGIRVNLFTGKPTTRKPKHQKKDRSGNSELKLLRDAWDQVKPCPFNRKAAENFLEIRRLARVRATVRHFITLVELIGWDEHERIMKLEGVEQWDELRDAIRKAKGSPEYSEYVKALRTLQQASGRFSNDHACLSQIVDENACRHLSGDIWESQEVYRSSSSGRSTAVGGGFQNASREMKQVMLGNIPNVFNYDMESSQDRILLEFLDEAGIPCPWLEEGLAGKDFKTEIAAQTGLSRETVKRCLHALKMGASVHKRRTNSVYEYIADDVGEEAAGAMLERFAACVRPLTDALAEWHAYLTGRWLEENAYRARANRRYVKNAIGKPFCVDAWGKNERGRKLAAHVLQGRESQFIHNLVLLSDRYGFDVLSLQHDGVITRGEVPDAAVEEVRQLTGMHYVRLVQKPFA